MNNLLTVAIPTMENFQQLGWCLLSLLDYTDFPLEIEIVSNSPKDRDMLESAVARMESRDRIRIRHMGYNSGWMGAINAALMDCKTPYFCMMNDDVVFIPKSSHFWSELIRPFNCPDVGAVGPCTNYVAGAQSLMAVGVPPVVSTTLLIGFCMVVRTAELQAMGGLDANLPGGDDLDLSIRYLKEGKHLIINRECYLHHFGQQTGIRVSTGWNSPSHQEATNNALIRKHGIKAWHLTSSAGWGPVPWATSNGEEASWLAEKLDKLRGSKGLDVGCGGRKIQGEGVEVVGIDIRPKGDTGVGGQKGLPCAADVEANAEKLPFGDGEVDFIHAGHLLEHLVAPLSALREWRRVLKEGGTILLRVPDQSRNDTISLDCTHLHAFTDTSLQEMVGLAGFDVVDCRSVDWGVLVLEASRWEGARA